MNKSRRSSRRRSPSIRSDETLDYKNISLLRRFVSEQGKILSRRMNRLTSKQQRLVAKIFAPLRYCICQIAKKQRR
ncbi:hypothetical protein KP509_28G030100 [Ceratopteris richardii]|uniref:Small ribosomal subunit protein bS18c n=1 Tax=Ceratopteris richardii TaxID=49495 RepID=A0A8T2RCI3_CERRI|nr:hypothetical protein KP509_28G030100 [Ceratopteris richardii]